MSCQDPPSCQEAGEEATVDPTQGLLETEKYLAQHFLSESHYKKIHQSLASRWDRLHSLSAAMKLMEKYGVVLSKEEEQRLADMDESQQINALVMKMPQQSNEQFQQFFLQLQLLVSTATRVRRALEDGRPDLVEEALNDADSTGISPYILRMAIVQAGTEVAMLRAQYTAWMKEADAKCGKLIRGQEDAMTAKKKLAAAQAQLNMYTAGQNEKAKKVIMNFAAQSDKGLTTSCFTGWRSHVKQMKLENEIRKEYAERIEAAEKRLADYKEGQLGNVRGMMMKKAMTNDQNLVTEIFRTWKEEVMEARDRLLSADKVKELEERLKSMQATQTENTKRVMMRMTAESDGALVSMVWQAFLTFHADYQKNKEMEDRVEAAEKQIAEFNKTKSEGAKKVLEKMSGATDSGLVQMTWKGWKEAWEDAKREAEMEAIINGQNSKLSAFASKNKDSGMNAMERSRYHMEQAILLRCWGAWREDCKIEVILRTYHAKIEAKRTQLVGVQYMFRNFAQQLESNLKASADTSRDLREGPPPGRRLAKSDGTVSLPDINAKPNSGRPQKPVTPNSRMRTPTGPMSPASAVEGASGGPRAAWG